MRRIDREKATVEAMCALFCRIRHGSPDGALCVECGELFEYSCSRLDACRFGDSKPTCARCPVHCYAPSMRKRMRELMRWAGPRMIWYHPALALRHLADTLKRP